MKLVVGLGNIGKEFEQTNHNMGFMVVDRVAKQLGLQFKKQTCQSLVAEGNFKGEKVLLAKPCTYMNLSGVAVKSLIKKFGVAEGQFLIISDDIDLPRSHVRFREAGTAGTHNGLRNIVENLGTTSFKRLRVGIGKPELGQDLKDFVLDNCHKDAGLEEGIEKATTAVIMFLEGTSEQEIMRKVN